ncbi:hypothetical protein CANARDRAFT_217454, partial [[Candida] arabinofermentans NRRL YB-2248]
MKQFHWDKLDNISTTFWGKLDYEQLNDKLDQVGVLNELETFFVASAPTMRAMKPKKEEDHSNKKILLLPRETQQQFGINLHQFGNLTEEQFISKVLECDSTITDNLTLIEFFNNESLGDVSSSLMRDFAPYSTNYRVKNFKTKKNPNDLARFDRIYLELFYNLSSYWAARSRALLLIQTFERDYEHINEKLDIVDAAITGIRGSESFLEVLNIIKNLGNFMNDESKVALGFKLSTLQRLKFLKDTKNTMSLLHYIEKIIRLHFPELCGFVDDLKATQKVARVSIENLEAECAELKRTTDICLSSLEKGKLSDDSNLHPRDQIKKYAKPSIEKAKLKSEALATHMKETISNFNELMSYFGENTGDDTSRSSFFLKFSSFIEDFKKVHAENIRTEEE